MADIPQHIAKQTYRLDGKTYFPGRPIPGEVVQKHGLQNVTNAPDTSGGDDPGGNPEAVKGYPAGFPKAEALKAAGFATAADAQAAEDDELDAIDGIGPSTIEDIRAFDLSE